MSLPSFYAMLRTLAGIEPAMAMLWIGLAFFTVGLAILMYTRWGQSKPLRKCMAMSLLVHLLLAGYATTIEIVSPMMNADRPILVTLGDGPDENAPPGGDGPLSSEADDQPWAIFPSHGADPSGKSELKPAAPDPPAEPEQVVSAQDATPSAVDEDKPIATPEDSRPESPSLTEPDTAAGQVAENVPPQPSQPGHDDLSATLLQPVVPLPKMTAIDMRSTAIPPTQLQTVDNAEHVGSHAALEKSTDAERSIAPDDDAQNVGRAIQRAAQSPVPDAYRLRVAPDREGIAQSHGGTSETEKAVKTALRWLADHQAADGRWNPRDHDAGKELNILGRNRKNAGSRADTAMTGLALLAFLGSGHTHLDGPYRQDVRRGLEFLMRSQAADGNLGGQAASFEFMYCHAMAACALSEAYGLTRDPRLRFHVVRALDYTIAAQDPRGGGWRYRPGDPGDTSQLGWQLMALKSADLAGIPIPENTRQGMIRYLQSVSSGKHGGLASYRPGEKVSRTMTAEALVCWQFLGLAREHPACNEAGDFLLAELPGQSVYNLYYWYYATLGMYQLQGDHWQRWNNALRTELVARQVKEGPLAGSWDIDDLWGGYGGRVYTTALATLTLEVYYRFLPLYADVASRGNRLK